MIAVLGVDTGFSHTGLALVGWDGSTARILDHATIDTEPTAKKRRLLVVDDHVRRIREIRAGIHLLMIRASVVALEAFSQHRNAASAARQAFGYSAAVCCADALRLPLVQSTPQEVHKRLGVPKPTPLPKMPKGATKEERREVERERDRVRKSNKAAVWVRAAMLCDGEWAAMTEHSADAACAALAALHPEPVDVVRAAMSPSRTVLCFGGEELELKSGEGRAT